MGLYTAFDLHSTISYGVIINEQGQKIGKKRLPNDPEGILQFLEPYRAEIVGVVVESTYNCYWLVDLLMSNVYRVHLANTAAIQKYNGLKHSDDKDDAFWLAEMLRLAILPTGHIYPKDERPLRDLLRKRGHLVKLRTSLIISLQNIIDRNYGVRINVGDIKRLKENRVAPFVEGNEDLSLVGSVSKETIDFLSSNIRTIESSIEDRAKLKEPYEHLLTIPGIGKILALTIMLETALLIVLRKSEIMYPTAGRYRPSGPVMTRKRARAARRTATNIWPGHFQRRRNLRGGTTRRQGSIINARCRRRTSW